MSNSSVQLNSRPHRWITNQIVWTRWSDKWYPAIIIDPSDQWIGLQPKLEGYQHVMWLGDGRVSQVQESDMQDFCQGFLNCHPHMNRADRYVKAVDLAIQLAIARSQETVNTDKVEWAKSYLHRFMELSVSQSFYTSLQAQNQSVAGGHKKSKSGKHSHENRKSPDRHSNSSSSGIEEGDSVSKRVDKKKRKILQETADAVQTSRKSKNSQQRARKSIKPPEGGTKKKKFKSAAAILAEVEAIKKATPKIDKSNVDLDVQKSTSSSHKKLGRPFGSKSKSSSTPSEKVPKSEDKKKATKRSRISDESLTEPVLKKPKLSTPRVSYDNVDITLVNVPLDMGWKREVSLRHESSFKYGDVYYHPPSDAGSLGKKGKLRSSVDVVRFLTEHEGQPYVLGLTARDNFSFKDRLETHHHNESIHAAADRANYWGKPSSTSKDSTPKSTLKSKDPTPKSTPKAKPGPKSSKNRTSSTPGPKPGSKKKKSDVGKDSINEGETSVEKRIEGGGNDENVVIAENVDQPDMVNEDQSSSDKKMETEDIKEEDNEIKETVGIAADEMIDENLVEEDEASPVDDGISADKESPEENPVEEMIEEPQGEASSEAVDRQGSPETMAAAVIENEEVSREAEDAENGSLEPAAVEGGGEDEAPSPKSNVVEDEDEDAVPSPKSDAVVDDDGFVEDRDEVAPSPKSEAFEEGDEVAPSPKSDVVEDRDEVAPSPKSEVFEDGGEVAPSPKSEVVEDGDEVAPSPISEVVEDGDEVAPSPKSEVGEEGDEVAPSPKPEVGEEGDEVAPSPKSEVVEDGYEVAPSPKSEVFEDGDEGEPPSPESDAVVGDDRENAPSPKSDPGESSSAKSDLGIEEDESAINEQNNMDLKMDESDSPSDTNMNSPNTMGSEPNTPKLIIDTDGE